MADRDSGTVAVLAEKPSVARDIAKVLGATSKGNGYLHGNGYVVTWAIGHLAALAQPHEINPAWRQWRRENLPMLPDQWPLTIYEKTKEQFEVVRKIVNSPRIARVVCATDAGREGELIFRYIYEAARCAKPVSRLWISSLTPEAIRKGFAALKPGSEYDPLADAARGRSRADWLVGMNLSRAYTLAYGEDLSVGRVQTPTLAMLVERELAIRSFVAEEYLEVEATFHPEGAPAESRYRGTWFRALDGREGDQEKLQKAMRLAADGEEAARMVARARTGAAAIESIELAIQRIAPLPLYDLTELQRHANRLFGFSAQKTLDVAQALYERHKLISYPRTDSRHLSGDVAATLPRIVEAIARPYREHLAPGTGERPLGRRFVDDAKVTDHHAIIPTATRPDTSALSSDERKIHDLVCRRLLSAWHDDQVSSVTTVITAIRNGDIADHYHTSGTTVQQVGWKALEIAVAKKAARAKDGAEDRKADEVLPPDLKKDDVQHVVEVEALRKKTRPPKRFTEATLLTAMETAGKTLDDKELSDAMKETGLGTPATRAAIIEVLLARGYMTRNGKSLEATDKGVRLIEAVHPEVKSPAMTGQWEAHLTRIRRGTAELDPFLRGIEDYVRDVVGRTSSLSPKPAAAMAASNGHEPAHEALPGHEPPRAREEPPPRATFPSRESPPARIDLPVMEAGDTLATLLHRAFGFAAFRPNQEAVCQAAVEGNDVLLVMPTGSGKSLCYQLPAIARGGTALVISPLIALMEDQVAKLRERGFAVERIHSGRERAASRQACLDYCNGKLQFLFIAPERLRVEGFPELLGKRKPSLIAIDEAHCISQWGHDFRPDYRMLGQHVPALRPAPVIALTATATPMVQDDIAAQLGLVRVARFIHGFRRANLAIEAIEAAPSRRAGLVCGLLLDEERRPGIVYTPTRKQAESVAAEVAAHFPASAYHAGLDAERRQRVQESFLSGETEVIVATIAFGMGIDKPDVRTVIHTALPGSIEAYYQEIGRAGRDGKPSRAVLMHSYADRYTHDFFLERDYPKVEVLDRIYVKLRNDPVEKTALRKQVRVDADEFDRALEKLWSHGGALMDYAENVSAGQSEWRDSYLAHCEQKRAKIDQMMRFPEVSECRMSALVRHFGDVTDARTSCGICDFCAPADCVAQVFRAPTSAERAAVSRLAAALSQGAQKSTGKLHGELFPTGELSRDEFEELLGALARAGLAVLHEAVFEKDGRQIPYRTVRLSAAGEEADDLASAGFLLKGLAESPATRRGRRSAANGGTSAAKRKQPRKRTAARKAAAAREKQPLSGTDAHIEEALRAWRLAEARKLGVPAFRIFTDRSLRAIAESRPTTAVKLLAVPGIGSSTVAKYGGQIYRIVGEVR